MDAVVTRDGLSESELQSRCLCYPDPVGGIPSSDEDDYIYHAAAPTPSLLHDAIPFRVVDGVSVTLSCRYPFA